MKHMNKWKEEVDNLNGLKENIIVGRLIPAGTGLMASQYHDVANKEQREEEEAKLVSDTSPITQSEEEVKSDNANAEVTTSE